LVIYKNVLYNFDVQLWRIAFENQHSHIWENCFHENQMDLCIKTTETLDDFFFKKIMLILKLRFLNWNLWFSFFKMKTTQHWYLLVYLPIYILWQWITLGLFTEYQRAYLGYGHRGLLKKLHRIYIGSYKNSS
jgi:hypothetical protein